MAAPNCLDPLSYLLGENAVKIGMQQLERQKILKPTLVSTRKEKNQPNASTILQPSLSTHIISCHISIVGSFLNRIAFKTIRQKNWRHPHAVECNEPWSPRMLVLRKTAIGMEHRKTTKICVVVLVCRGTYMCIPSTQHGRTSPRRFCGYGIRLFSKKEDPTIVHIEEFGAHVPSLSDLGWRFVPPPHERLVLTPLMEVDAMVSFSNGVKPAKQMQILAEGDALMGRSCNYKDLLKALQQCHRRYKYAIEARSDEEGVENISNHFSASESFIFERTEVPNGNWVIFLSHVSFTCQASSLGDVIGLDATHNVTCSKNVYLFAIMGRCPAGAIPLAYFVTNAKDEQAIMTGLEIFKLKTSQLNEGCDTYEPRAVCIDMDMASNNAIRRVFPCAIVIYCHYHFMCNMVNQARSLRHGLSSEDVRKLMSQLRKLASSTSHTSFLETLKVVNDMSPSFFSYLDENYLNDAWIDTFVEVNRSHLPLSVQRLCRSNMLTEVSFRTLKYIVLGGYMNKRLDMLLYSLGYRMFPYFLSRVCLSEDPPPRFLIKLDAKEKGTYLYMLVVVSYQLYFQLIDEVVHYY